MKNKSPLLIGAFLSLMSGAVLAESNNSVIASLNGNKIYAQQVDDLVKVATDDGATVPPEAKQRITNELLIREAIVQDAKKTGLATKNNNKLKLKLAEQNAIAELWFADYFISHPISEAELKSEYDRQLAISKDPKNANEYSIAQIAVATESEANQIISKLNGKTSFESLAKQYSIEKNIAQQGGMIGWTLSGNFTAPLNDIVPNLSKGRVSSRPIRIGDNFYIIKLIDIRPFKLPSYEDSKNQLAQQVIQKEREQAITDLFKSSNLKIGE